jgi:hypothetical protein
MVDLHIHTTASDGQYSPAAIVEMAKEKQLSLIAITDHDTVSGVAEGASAARNAGIGFIPGIEISVKGNRELHILGYNIDPLNSALLLLCEEFAENRRQRGPRILEYLRGYDIHLDLDQVQIYTGGGLLGRPHFAQALVAAGYVKTTREAFDKYLGTPEFQKVERPKPTPKEGIKAILGAGGTAVLAHPVQIGLPEPELERLIKEFTGYGLGGVECYYSEHTPEMTEFYLSLARKYGLCVTGGSDYHGDKVKPEISLGSGINGSLHVHVDDVSLTIRE